MDWRRHSARRDRARPAPQRAMAITANPLAPIRVGQPLDRRAGRRALPSAFNPIGPSGALVQTREGTSYGGWTDETPANLPGRDSAGLGFRARNLALALVRRGAHP